MWYKGQQHGEVRETEGLAKTVKRYMHTPRTQVCQSSPVQSARVSFCRTIIPWVEISVLHSRSAESECVREDLPSALLSSTGENSSFVTSAGASSERYLLSTCEVFPPHNRRPAQAHVLMCRGTSYAGLDNPVSGTARIMKLGTR